MAVTFNIRTPPAAAPGRLLNERVGILGVETGTAAVGTLYDAGGGNDDLTAAIAGATSDAWEAVQDVRGQVDVHVTLSPLAAALTPAAVTTALNLFLDVTPPVTSILAAGDVGSIADRAAAINTWCRAQRVRGLVSAPIGASPANLAAAAATAAAFPANYDHVLAAFGAPTGEYPAPWAMGAILREQRDFGRAHGIEQAPVSGMGELQFPMTQSSPQLAALDNAGIVSIINTATGGHALSGGFLGYTDANEIRRNWSIARVVDHVTYLLVQRWNDLVGSTRSLENLAHRLYLAVQPLIGREVADFSVTPDAAMSMRGNKVFNAILSLVHPAEDLAITMNVTERNDVTLSVG